MQDIEKREAQLDLFQLSPGASRRVEAVDASPWQDWQLAEDLKDACLPWAVVAHYRKDRHDWETVEPYVNEDAREKGEELGYRHPSRVGIWPEGPTPDEMVREAIGAPEKVTLSHHGPFRQRWKRVTNYIIALRSPDIPDAMRAGRDDDPVGARRAAMLAECAKWFREKHGRAAEPDAYDGDVMPPLDLLMDLGITPAELDARAQGRMLDAPS